jgi:hypothetical protein
VTTAAGLVKRFVRRTRRPPRRFPTVSAQSGRAGQALVDTATLDGGTAPTGSITFTLYGPDNPDCSGDGIFHSIVPVTGNGTYSSDEFTVENAGTYTWRATYSGDGNNN